MDDNLAMHESVAVYVETRGFDTLRKTRGRFDVTRQHDTPGVWSSLKTWCRLDMNPSEYDATQIGATTWAPHHVRRDNVSLLLTFKNTVGRAQYFVDITYRTLGGNRTTCGKSTLSCDSRHAQDTLRGLAKIPSRTVPINKNRVWY